MRNDKGEMVDHVLYKEEGGVRKWTRGDEDEDEARVKPLVQLFQEVNLLAPPPSRHRALVPPFPSVRDLASRFPAAVCGLRFEHPHPPLKLLLDAQS